MKIELIDKYNVHGRWAIMSIINYSYVSANDYGKSKGLRPVNKIQIV